MFRQAKTVSSCVYCVGEYYGSRMILVLFVQGKKLIMHTL